MNKAAIDYAYQQKCGSPGAKAVLVALAHHVNFREVGPLMACWPSQSRIAEMTEMTREHVCRVLKELCKKGVIKKDGRKYFLPVANVISDHNSEDEKQSSNVTSDHIKSDLTSQGCDLRSQPSEVKKELKKKITTTPPKSDPPKKVYAYEGDVIRLLEKDLDRHRKKHSNLSDLELQAALDQIDFAFRSGSSDNWFFRLERNLDIAADKIVKGRKASHVYIDAETGLTGNQLMEQLMGRA